MKERKITILVLCTVLCAILIVTVLCILDNKSDTSKAETLDTMGGETLESDSTPEEKNPESINVDTEAEHKTTEVEETTENVPNNEATTTSNETSSANSSSTAEYTTKYYIKVNYEQNVVTIYEKDADGNYTVPVKAMICSTGSTTPTSGVYTIKYRWEWLGLFGDVYGYYVTQITGNILFHSVPYTAKSPDTLEYWEYDKLGTSASLGCVRLKVVDAKWIYDNVVWGTPVEFYASSNPGPLGKPTAQKISDNEACRNWDPTDSDSRNPWNLKEEPKIQESVEESEQNNLEKTPGENVNIYSEVMTK